MNAVGNMDYSMIIIQLLKALINFGQTSKYNNIYCKIDSMTTLSIIALQQICKHLKQKDQLR